MTTQFLRLTTGDMLSERAIRRISSRVERAEAKALLGEDLPDGVAAAHAIFAIGDDEAEYVASAREVARFLKACEVGE